jgi:UDP-glucose 4-epimerase
MWSSRNVDIPCLTCGSLDYVAFRYFNLYGERMDIHGRYTEVLIRWMDRLEAGQAPIIFGDARQTMDFVHVRDVAREHSERQVERQR